MDYQALPPIDVYLMCEPEAAVPMLLEAATGAHGRRRRAKPGAQAAGAVADAVST